MKVSISWVLEVLGASVSEEELDNSLVKLGLEVEGIDGDTIEISIPANRGDCLSVYGLARELATVYEGKLDTSINSEKTITTKGKHNKDIRLDSAQKCPKYLGCYIEGVNNNIETPEWIVSRLNCSDIQSISPIVDITNYVMLELGQPLHAFDADKINGDIIVRNATASENLELLDGQLIDLKKDDLVIADDESPLALAGIMGGMSSGVSDQTKNIFLECAWFEPIGIRLSARSHKLQTDSSYRFERGVDSQLQKVAISRAAELITSICHGVAYDVSNKTIDTYLPKLKETSVGLDKIRSMLGINISAAEVEKVFTSLGMDVSLHKEDCWNVMPPSHRFDIEIEEDLVEEVARVVSLDSIPYEMPKVISDQRFRIENEKTIQLQRLKDIMVGLGFNETINYSFISPNLAKSFGALNDSHRVINPISEDLSVMRQSLWPSLVKSMEYNKNRQIKRVKIFEVGSRYQVVDGKNIETKLISGLMWGSRNNTSWCMDKAEFDFYDAKATVEDLLQFSKIKDYGFVKDSDYALSPGQSAKVVTTSGKVLGHLGQLHPRITADLGLPEGVFLFELELNALIEKRFNTYTGISKFPAVRRDVSFLVDKNIRSQEVIDLILESCGAILKVVDVIDCYQGGSLPHGKKSMAYSLFYQDPSRTLLDDEIDSDVKRIITKVNEQLGASLREQQHDVN